MKKGLGIFLLCTGMVLSLAIIGCNSGSNNNAGFQQNGLRKISLLIDWKAEPTYAGFYIAREKGFYRKRGIDVEIVEGNGATNSAKIIGEGSTYFIGSCSGAATAIARSKQIPVKSVAVLYPNVPTVIYSRADTPIKQPSDMIGKRIGVIDGSITADEYRGVVAANKIDRSKIKEIGVGFDVAPLLSKQLDGLMNYEELTPVELRLQGHQIEVMRFADYGVKAYSLNLIVNNSSIDREKQAIQAIVEGTIEGYEFLRTSPDEAAAIFSRLYPERSPKYISESTKIVAALLGKGPVGQQTIQGWKDTINTLQSLGLIQGEVKTEDVAVAQYLKDQSQAVGK